MKTRVFVAKTDDLNTFFKEGFEMMLPTTTGGEIILYKEVNLTMHDEIVVNLINVYNSKNWKMYSNRFKQYYENIGLSWDEQGILEYNEDITKVLTTWRFEIDFSDVDKCCRLVPYDLTFPNPLYPTKWIEKYVKDITTPLIEKGIIGYKYLDA